MSVDMCRAPYISAHTCTWAHMAAQICACMCSKLTMTKMTTTQTSTKKITINLKCLDVFGFSAFICKVREVEWSPVCGIFLNAANHK